MTKSLPIQQERSFRLLRLRFLRLPPSWIQLSSSKSGAFLPVELELAVGITDDYGVHVGSFEALELSLQAVDLKTRLPIPGITISLGKLSPTSHFTLNPSSGDFHTLRVTLSFDKFIGSFPPSINFLLSTSKSPPDSATKEESLEEREMEMLAFLGETEQVPIDGWDDERYVFLRVLSGDVELKGTSKKKGAEMEGTSSGGVVSTSKVQTTFRTIHIPNSSSTADGSPPSSITILERPGLNNSTGQRLWDAAIVLSFYLSQNPTVLTSYPISSLNTRPRKRSKPDQEPSSHSQVQVLELGAGCGLVGITAASLFSTSTSTESTRPKVILTDTEATVETTLLENLTLNSPLPSSSLISSATLDWGPLSSTQISSLLPSHNSTSLTILGSDILYNPSSHQVLLETLRDLFAAVRRKGTGAKALVAYKPRTEGDGDFFDMVQADGMKVECRWRWGEVSVWELWKG